MTPEEFYLREIIRQYQETIQEYEKSLAEATRMITVLKQQCLTVCEN